MSAIRADRAHFGLIHSAASDDHRDSLSHSFNWTNKRLARNSTSETNDERNRRRPRRRRRRRQAKRSPLGRGRKSPTRHQIFERRCCADSRHHESLKDEERNFANDKFLSQIKLPRRLARSRQRKTRDDDHAHHHHWSSAGNQKVRREGSLAPRSKLALAPLAITAPGLTKRRGALKSRRLVRSPLVSVWRAKQEFSVGAIKRQPAPPLPQLYRPQRRRKFLPHPAGVGPSWKLFSLFTSQLRKRPLGSERDTLR